MQRSFGEVPSIVVERIWEAKCDDPHSLDEARLSVYHWPFPRLYVALYALGDIYRSALSISGKGYDAHQYRRCELQKVKEGASLRHQLARNQNCTRSPR